MGFTSKKLSSNRTFIYYLQRRASRFHSPIMATAQFDITELLARIDAERAGGRRIGLVSYFIKATAETLKAHPRFNQRIFHTFWGSPRIATFDEISCNTVVARQGPHGEELLIPLVLRHTDTMSVEAIQNQIRESKTTPLDEMPAVAQLAKVSRLPRWVIRLLHRKFARDPAFLISKVGTYGVSALPHRGSGAVTSFTPTTQTAFFPTSIAEHVVPIDGEMRIRTLMVCTVTSDHNVVDGLDLQRLGLTLKGFIENPDRLLGPLEGHSS